MITSCVDVSLLGKRVIMHATGDNCVRDFDRCIGTVTRVDDSYIMLKIEEGHSNGNIVGFTIGGDGFTFDIYQEDWDL